MVGARPHVQAWVWLFGILLCGEALFFWPAALDQFLLPKEVLLVAGIAAVLAVRAAGRSGRNNGGSRLRIPAVLAVFAAWSVIAPLGVSRNLELHLLGSVELLALLLGAVLAGAVREEAGPDGARILLKATAGAALTVALLTVLQALGLDPFRNVFGLSAPGRGRWRVLTTLGNPNWTAELLAVALPLMLASGTAVIRERRYRRTARALLVAVIAAAVGATGSRGGLVALAAGGAVFWGVGARGERAKRMVRMSVAVVVILAVGATVALGIGASRWSSLPSITGRLGLWAAGSHLVARAPLRGGGLHQVELMLPEGLAAVVSRVGTGVRRWMPSTLVDRFDNDLIQTAVGAGLPAAVLLLAVYGVALRRAWRRATDAGDGIDAAVCGSLVACGVASIVSSPLHTPATAMLFWIVAGLALARRERMTGGTAREAPRWRRLTALFVTVVIAFLAVLGAGRALEGDALAGRGRRLVHNGDPAGGVRDLREGLRLVPWLGAGYGALADALLESGRPAAALVVTGTGAKWTASEKLWALRARAWAELGRWNEARAEIERGLRVLPSSKVLLAARARLVRMQRVEAGKAASIGP